MVTETTEGEFDDIDREYNGDIVQFTTLDDISKEYNGDWVKFTTEGLKYTFTVNNITPNSADLILDIEEYNNISERFITFYINNEIIDSFVVTSTGTFTRTVNLEPNKIYRAKITSKDGSNIKSEREITFKSDGVEDKIIQYNTEITIDTDNDINITPLINALSDNKTDEITTGKFIDDNDIIYESDEINIVSISERTIEIEFISFSEDTDDTDIIDEIQLHNSSEFVSYELDNITGAQRISVIIPIRSR